MIIISAVLEVDYNDYNETGDTSYQLPVSIVMLNITESEASALDDTELADLISDETGHLVSEVISIRTPDVVINYKN